jgi:hypothetical protein
MKMLDQMKGAWLNTRDLPSLARWFIRFGMIFCPILVFVVMLPLWSSGTFLPASIWMALLAIGCWGVAARKPNYRWILVFSSFATEAASILFVPLRVTDIASAGWWSIVVYVCLFHSRSIRSYLSEGHSKSVSESNNAS